MKSLKRFAAIAGVSETTIQRMTECQDEVVGFGQEYIKRVVAAIEKLGWDLIEHDGRAGLLERPKRQRRAKKTSEQEDKA